MSRVFNADAHLSSDQIYSATLFLGFSEDEKKFIQLLHERDRSSLKERRDGLSAAIDKFRAKMRKTEKNLSVRSKKGEAHEYTRYYLDPRLQVLHMLATLPEYSSLPALLQAGRIATGLGPDSIKAALAVLQSTQVIEVDGNRVKVIEDQLHLPSHSPLHLGYQTALRLLAVEKIRDAVLIPGSNPNGRSPYNTGAIFTASQEARDQIHRDFLGFLKGVQILVNACKDADQVYQFNFDLFRWG